MPEKNSSSLPAREKGATKRKIKSIASKHSSFYVSLQSPQGKNNYSSDYHNTVADDLLEIAANLLGCVEVDQ